MAAGTAIQDWNKLGALVRQTRQRNGWSQTALAGRAGVSRAWLAKVEAGHRGAELEQVLMLLDALGLTLVAEATADEVPSSAAAGATQESVVAAARSSAADRREAAWQAAWNNVKEQHRPNADHG